MAKLYNLCIFTNIVKRLLILFRRVVICRRMLCFYHLKKKLEPFTKHVCKTCPQLFNLAQRSAAGCAGLSHCRTCVSTKHSPVGVGTESRQWQGGCKDDDSGRLGQHQLIAHRIFNMFLMGPGFGFKDKLP